MKLWSLLHNCREIHEIMLRNSQGSRDSAGSCAFAAYFVDLSIKRWLPQMQSVIRGGDGAADGGYFATDGRGHGHYWVELDDGTDKWVADITGDQFGEPPILLCLLADAEARYRPGNASTIEEHMELFQEWLIEAGKPPADAQGCG